MGRQAKAAPHPNRGGQGRPREPDARARGRTPPEGSGHSLAGASGFLPLAGASGPLLAVSCSSAIRIVLRTAAVLTAGGSAWAKTVVLTPGLHRLRVTQQREWSDFPARPEGPSLSLRFSAEPNAEEWSLR